MLCQVLVNGWFTSTRGLHNVPGGGVLGKDDACWCWSSWLLAEKGLRRLHKSDMLRGGGPCEG